MVNPENTRIMMTLSPEMLKRLSAEAKTTGVSKSAIMALALRQYFQTVDVQPVLDRVSQLLVRSENSKGGSV